MYIYRAMVLITFLQRRHTVTNGMGPPYSLHDIDKAMGQSFNREPVVNGTAGTVHIMLESRTPIHVCQQLPWS
jgi:hypothetical protein